MMLQQKSGQLTISGFKSGLTETDFVNKPGVSITIKLSYLIEHGLYKVEVKATVPKYKWDRYLLGEYLTKSYSDMRTIKRWAKKHANHYEWDTPHHTNGDNHFTSLMCCLASDYKAAMSIIKRKLNPMGEDYALRHPQRYK